MIDPMRGVRGVFAAVLVLEAIVVLLALLVLPKFGEGATPLGVGIISGLALLMIVAAGVQRRSWGLPFALALQVAAIACGLLVPALGVMGAVFALVWVGLLLMRRDVAQKMERGELPAQLVEKQQEREASDLPEQ
ncbi:DUF4233 domain-containing protein [Pseudonocardia sp. TRM90224]|uniref:DUF4233 domain-containing protein n=1 Tax=Pseudonocardia sp. TRM90224 TaxID=2812678 RepID=UPI001E3AD092|nr:DUF4233 domain-containing protein [Pseudonocardia sp. TRM90224]